MTFIAQNFILQFSSFSSFYFILPLLGLATVLIGRQIANHRRLSTQTFPPGPNPKILIGNYFDFPKANAAQRYLEWETTYNSKILHASYFGEHFMILNSFKDAEALLDKRANNYSDRPDYPAVKLMGWSENTAFMRSGERWQRHRRLAQQHLRQSAVENHYPTIARLVHETLQKLLECPERFGEYNKELSVGIAMAVMYGYPLRAGDHAFIESVEWASSEAFKLLQPGFSLVNVLPSLMIIPSWFPMASAQETIHQLTDKTYPLVMKPMEYIKENIRNGIDIPCIVSSLFSREDFVKEDEDSIAGLAFTAYVGASDTTTVAINTFFYLMVTHPRIQKKAQEEIDRVVGRDRLPEFKDRRSLPYVDAIYRELLRWQPPTLTGLNHRAKKDDTYNGYFIQEGTTIIPNIWAMTRDESIYKDPYVFNPERFINANGELNDDDRILTFGFGRRVCVGIHLASSSLWLTLASILAVFELGQAKDEEGRMVDVNGEFEDPHIIVQKKPFKCSILPRSGGSRRVVEEALMQNN